MTRFAWRGIVAALSFGALAAHAAPSYHFVDLGTVGGAFSVPHDINNLGQIVGQSQVSDSSGLHAVLWSNGSVTDLTALAGGTGGSANAINDAGQIVGSNMGTGPSRATLWQNGNGTFLGANGVESAANDINQHGQIVGRSGPQAANAAHSAQWSSSDPATTKTVQSDASNGQAVAINNAGAIVGERYTADGTKPYLVSGGTQADLPLKGFREGSPAAINDHGTVAGNVMTIWGDSAKSMPAMWMDGKLQFLTVPAGFGDSAADINAAGWIVGATTQPDFQSHATLWANNTLVDLNAYIDPQKKAEGWWLYSATAINDRGDIVGLLGHGDLFVEQHAFLLQYEGGTVSPVPEPETWAMVLASLGALGIIRKRAAKNGGA